MPLSDDPDKRARQLANLPNMRGEATSTAWKPGDSPALKHGARSRMPQASPEWSPAVELAIADLEGRVDASLRDENDALYPWAQPSVEAVALQKVTAHRFDRYVADREARGVLTAADLESQSKVTERYHRALDREALTLRSRVDVQAQSFDLARHWAREGGSDAA